MSESNIYLKNIHIKNIYFNCDTKVLAEGIRHGGNTAGVVGSGGREMETTVLEQE